ncbi:MAG: peptidoglycan DD-metalloendopeptidase family protein [Methylovulum sp.]|nr:peptidoglycan DD-metalloendopeptidase family protein [Methylovulum sp.]
MKRQLIKPIFLFSLTLANIVSGQTPDKAMAQQAHPPTTAKKTAAAQAPKPNKAKIPTGSIRKKPPATVKYYQVKPGETLYSISVKTGQVFQNLAQWNNLPSPYQVKEGQILTLSPPPEEQEQSQAKPVPVKEKREAVQKFTIPPTKKPPIPAIIKAPKAAPPKPIRKVPALVEKKTSIPIADKKMLKLAFRWPMNGVVVKSFTQSNHQGIDIENKTGKQAVLAAETGRVVYTGQGLSSLKNLIIIQHNEQYLTAYANNSHVLVKEEQRVAAGQRIAELSAPANKPNILHFQIRKNGIPVNPLNLLPK